MLFYLSWAPSLSVDSRFQVCTLFLLSYLEISHWHTLCSQNYFPRPRTFLSDNRHISLVLFLVASNLRGTPCTLTWIDLVDIYLLHKMCTQACCSLRIFQASTRDTEPTTRNLDTNQTDMWYTLCWVQPQCCWQDRQ